MNAAKTTLTGALCAAALMAGTAQAAPGKPNFTPALYGDGEVWGTKATTTLPAPNPNNEHSYDHLYVVINGNPAAQLPVSEAAPGNPDYNGGRWFTHTATWTEAALDMFEAMGKAYPPVLKSGEAVEYWASMGYLDTSAGSFPGGPPPYFQCPMLPVK